MHVGLPSRITRRIAASLSVLVSPGAYANNNEWRFAVARDLQCLVGADAAFVATERDGVTGFQAIDLDRAIVHSYQHHYASVDLGMARQRSCAIEVWCRRSLWGAEELRRSEYYNDFARPNGLHDSAGICASVYSLQVRVSLLYSRLPRSRRAVAWRAALLQLALPAFRTGVALSVNREAPHDEAPWRARYRLTEREAEVTQLLRKRRSNAEIARMLHISAHTARHHTENVLLKLGVHSRYQVEDRLGADVTSVSAASPILRQP